MRTGVDRRGITVLSLGHGAVDLAQGAVPALLPFFIHRYGYSYAEASALLLASTGSSSLIQPLFGYLADRRPVPWLLPVGVFLAAGGIACAGLLQNFWLTFLFISLSGLGAGSYHPEAARYANYVSGSRSASGMSFFAVGGNVGFALGPIITTPLILIFGLSGTVFLAIPLVAAALAVTINMGHLNSFRPSTLGPRRQAARAGSSPDQLGAFSLVTLIASMRSGVYFGLQAFVPAYLIAKYGFSEGAANISLILFLVSGALGTIVGGQLGDRIGLKLIAVVCMAMLSPLVLLLLAGGEIVALPMMALLGFFAVATFSITVVLGQRFLPSRIGMASGVTLGASVGAGGVIAALLGLLADSAGLTTVLLIIAALPLPGLIAALLLPGDRPRRSEPAATAATRLD